MRINDDQSLGQLRTPSEINQYSTEEQFEKECLEPDLAPSDLIPMGLETKWANPGEQMLRREGEITELSPLGPKGTDVFPWTNRAPADTTNIDYEDEIPRKQYRGDQILRSRVGVRGPGAYWHYGGDEDKAGEMEGMGQPEEDPISFVRSPSEVAYQTYPGPSMGDLDPKNLRFLIYGGGTGALLFGASFIPGIPKDVVTLLRYSGFIGTLTVLGYTIYKESNR